MKHTTFLALDDVRTIEMIANYAPKELKSMYYDNKWDIVRDYNEFIDYIMENGVPDVISFDHDLDSEHYDGSIDIASYIEHTGYDATKWLIDYCRTYNVPFPEAYCHSANPVGKENIEIAISKYKEEEDAKI